MRYRYKCGLLCMVLLCVTMILGGCTDKGTEEKIIEDAAMVDSGYKVYRIAAGCKGLESEEWKFHSVTPDDLVQECVDALCEQSDDKKYEKLLPDGVKLVNCAYSEVYKQADIYFNEAYQYMDRSHEVLCRAAIVETLTQFSGVIDYVQFFINGVSMQDADGRDVIMMASDFVSSTSADLKDLSEDNITLYFSSTDGRQLVKEEVSVRYYSSSPVERVVMESLILGPLKDGLQRTLPVNTKLNNITIEDGLCIVDLNQRFLEPLEGRVYAVKIYSIVNSLCALEQVNRVQILVDGIVSDYVEDDISIREPLEENKEIVLKNTDSIPVLETAEAAESETQETEE